MTGTVLDDRQERTYMDLLAAEITALPTGRIQASILSPNLTAKFGMSYYTRIDSPATAPQSRRPKRREVVPS